MIDDDRSAIAQASSRLLAAVNRSDVDGVMAVWADQGVMMPPGRAAVSGRSAIEAYFRDLFSRSRFLFQFTSSEIQIVGDVASERVTYVVDAWLDGATAPVHDRGRGIHLFRRGPGGAWALAADIWNSDGSAVS